MTDRFDEDNFQPICDLLGQLDSDLLSIINEHGYPPMWSRPPGFATLIHIILEQQVSLASALAAMNKLLTVTDTLTPGSLLALSDETLRACYFSRQKAGYARDLAVRLVDGSLDLEALQGLPDEAVRQQLKTVRGIGDWSSDIYLMMALRRTDCFPVGDVALLSSLSSVKRTGDRVTKERALELSMLWKPYRAVAAYLLWHAYLSVRIKKRK